MAETVSLVATRPLPVEPEAPEAVEPAGRRRALDLLPPLGLYLVSRLVVLAASIPAVFHSNPGAGPWPEITSGWALERVLTQWDGAWYIWVADRGYPTGTEYRHHLSDVAFFPGFPALIRGVASVTGLSTLHASMIV